MINMEKLKWPNIEGFKPYLMFCLST